MSKYNCALHCIFMNTLDVTDICRWTVWWVLVFKVLRCTFPLGGRKQRPGRKVLTPHDL